MDVVNKAMLKSFLFASVISFAISAAAYQWLLVLIVLWFTFVMGGVTFFRSINQTAFSIMWGVFLGLTFALALLLFGPWELYT